ncbi:MAG: hypothetical protein JSU72_15655 [Deltaproteobacteria bacterium]|nr:MAG: hypothetical protein JSU72_15655 [Deltaproteobacteria bacterium]
MKEYAAFMGVDLKIIPERISKDRGRGEDGIKQYTLWDAYSHADPVTYPFIYEGYGNAFVEAIFSRKPVVVNRYPIFEVDIEPKGFDVVVFDSFISKETVGEVRQLLKDSDRLAEMAETNYMLGWRYLSYEMLQEKLEILLVNIYGS